VKYRPMRLVELDEISKDPWTMETMYKAAFSHIDKKTACYITRSTKDEEGMSPNQIIGVSYETNKD